MKKLIPLFTLLIMLTLNTTQVISAQSDEASPSAEDKVNSEGREASLGQNGATPSAKTTQTLKERIEKIVQEKSEQIKGTMDELSKQKRGYIAQVQMVSEETITLKNNKGTTIVPIDEQVILVKKQKQIEIDQIAIDDWAIVMGYMEDDSLTPKRIAISSASLLPKPHIVSLGTIKSITSKKLDFKPRKNDDVISLTINSKTNFLDYEDNEAKLADFSQDIQCLLVGYEDDDGKVATTIRALAPLSLEEIE